MIQEHWRIVWKLFGADPVPFRAVFVGFIGDILGVSPPLSLIPERGGIRMGVHPRLTSPPRGDLS